MNTNIDARIKKSKNVDDFVTVAKKTILGAMKVEYYRLSVCMGQ